MSTDSVKLYKPSPKVYQLALKHIQLKKGEILFVSSNSFDVLGAKNFGFKVCWISAGWVSPLDPLGPKPDLVVQNFDELVPSVFVAFVRMQDQLLHTPIHDFSDIDFVFRWGRRFRESSRIVWAVCRPGQGRRESFRPAIACTGGPGTRLRHTGLDSGRV